MVVRRRGGGGEEEACMMRHSFEADTHLIILLRVLARQQSERVIVRAEVLKAPNLLAFAEGMGGCESMCALGEQVCGMWCGVLLNGPLPSRRPRSSMKGCGCARPAGSLNVDWPRRREAAERPVVHTSHPHTGRHSEVMGR